MIRYSCFILLLLCMPSWAQGQRLKKFKKKEIRLIESAAPNERLRVLTINDKKDSLLLRKPCKKVNLEKDKETVIYFSKRLKATVTDPKNMGVGIAAPQVGLLRRLIYVQRFDKENFPLEFYINPRIIEYSDSLQLGKEGCLSIPDKSAEVFRAQFIKIEYVDMDGKKHIEEISGFTSVIFQHEIDHLDGILYLDHLKIED
ncbi:MAG: peptide deformylase [Flavobacteriales bacterium]|nr:peptide deformylase [Flavobacteriales bacterium]